MKNIILTLGFFLIAINVNAQKWALPSSTWVIYILEFSSSFETVKIEKDTIIQGVSCKKLNAFNPIYTYEENDTVYFFYDDLFRPTYYFNAEVGDTISLYDFSDCLNGTTLSNDSTLFAVVDFIDSVDVGNKFLKRYNCSIFIQDTSLFFQGASFYYTELIGSNYIYPNIECVLDQASLNICSYGDSSIQDFYAFQEDFCVDVSIYELENQNSQISIYPNPIANFLNVQLDFNTESKILSIRNTMGQIVQKFTITQGENSLDISHLPSGVYFATLDGTENHTTIKFLKE